MQSELSQLEDKTIEQLYTISSIYSQWKIPYLTKVLNLLSYCGIKFTYQSQSQTQIKENQIVALGFFLQNLKQMKPTMSYKDLTNHIKASTHSYPEFKSIISLFEIIYNFKCETKETFKAIYTSNQLLLECDDSSFSNSLFAMKIDELFSTEDPNNGVITLEFLIGELMNIHNELIKFFFFFGKYIEGVMSNINAITNKIIDNPITKRISDCKAKCYETYAKMTMNIAINPMKILLEYYSHYAEMYQLNERYSNAKKYISDGIAVPLQWTDRLVFKPLDNVKVIILDKVVKLKTDLSALSESSRNKVMELSNDVIEKIKDQYGALAAWISVKGDYINVVIATQFASLNQKWLLEYIKMIKEISCYEKICECYQKWLGKGKGKEDQDENDGITLKEETKNRTDNGNSIQKPIELELAYSMVHKEEVTETGK